jgi:VanZ family protein
MIENISCPRPVCGVFLSMVSLAILTIWQVAPLSGDGPLIRELNNAAHFPLFGMLAAAIFLAIRLYAPTRHQKAWHAYFLTLVAMLCISSIAEWSQQFSARDASVDDVIVNMLGSTAALSIAALMDPLLPASAHRRLYRVGLVSLAMALAAIAAFPLAVTAAALAKRDADFPCVVCPTSWLDLRLLETNGADVALDGARDTNESALRIQLQNGQFPGVSWSSPSSDWRDYDTLVLEVTNPGATPTQLTLRIDDAKHNYDFADRFNHTIIVPSNGHLKECIPLSDLENAPKDRVMDLSQIAHIALFGNKNSHQRYFYLNYIRLTKHRGELCSGTQDSGTGLGHPAQAVRCFAAHPAQSGMRFPVNRLKCQLPLFVSLHPPCSINV